MRKADLELKITELEEQLAGNRSAKGQVQICLLKSGRIGITWDDKLLWYDELSQTFSADERLARVDRVIGTVDLLRIQEKN